MDKSPVPLALMFIVTAGCSTLGDENDFVRENQQRECLRRPTSEIQSCLQRAESEYAAYKSQAERQRERNARQAAEGAQSGSGNPRIGVP